MRSLRRVFRAFFLLIWYNVAMKIFRLINYVFLICGLFFTSFLFSESDPLPLTGVRSWAYQLQGLESSDAVAGIVDSRYDLVVVEPSVTCNPGFDTKDMVRRIKASLASDGIHRKLVIAYIDIGQAEEWRWYWGNHKTYEEYGECRQSYVAAIQTWAPWVVACDPDGWGGNYPVAFWYSKWKEIVIHGTTLGAGQGLYFNSMLDEVVQDGFDGVYLDWVDAWQMDAVRDRALSEGKDTGREMLKFIREIRSYGKKYNPDFIVIQQNSSELLNEVGGDELKTAVDAIGQEGTWWDGIGGNDDWDDPEGYDYPGCCTNYYLTRLRAYKNAGFPVFVIDYAVKKASEVYRKAAAEGFIAYASRRSLSKLSTTPPQFPPVKPPIITVDKSQLYFGAVTGSNNATAAQTINIDNSGGGILNWSITGNADWLVCGPASGTGASPVSVSVNIPGLTGGTYDGVITIADANAANSPRMVNVILKIYETDNDAGPFGSFDTPVDGSPVQGSVAVTGWALDDIGIESIKIYRENETGDGLVYIGDAVFIEGARPDLQQAYPAYPMNYKAGWGYMLLTNCLPKGGNGTFKLYAAATDSSGHEVTLGIKTITGDNGGAVKPFGALDAPAPGSTVSGNSYRVQGWALTPMPNNIAMDGSTIDVYVDGKKLGNPVYNIYRPDIAALFPGYANSNGAGAYYHIDTTKYSNGLHTVAWIVTDNAGNTDGIGSRYFYIRN